MKSYRDTIVTASYLDNNPNTIFVFGDNTIRRGKGGAAILRDHPQSYGFITKQYPNNKINSFYRIDEYYSVYREEIRNLISFIEANPNKIFLIAILGGGLANQFNIWDVLIKPSIKSMLVQYSDRITYLWD